MSLELSDGISIQLALDDGVALQYLNFFHLFLQLLHLFPFYIFFAMYFVNNNKLYMKKSSNFPSDVRKLHGIWATHAMPS